MENQIIWQDTRLNQILGHVLYDLKFTYTNEDGFSQIRLNSYDNQRNLLHIYRFISMLGTELNVNDFSIEITSDFSGLSYEHSLRGFDNFEHSLILSSDESFLFLSASHDRVAEWWKGIMKPTTFTILITFEKGVVIT